MAAVFLDELAEDRGRVCSCRFFCDTCQSRCGTVCLEASFSSAGALLAVDHDNVVTEFRTCLVESGENSVVDDNAASDTGAERDRYGISNICRRAGYALRHSCAVCVIVDIDGKIDHGTDDLSHRCIYERKVGRIDQCAGLVVRCSRGTDADRGYVGLCDAGLFDRLFCQFTHVCDDVFHRAVRICLDADLIQKLTFIRYYTGFDVCAAKIDSYKISHFKLSSSLKIIYLFFPDPFLRNHASCANYFTSNSAINLLPAE